MTTEPHQDDLHHRIAALLNHKMTGNAVARELNGRYAAWQARAAVGDLRARRAQHHVDATAEAMYPSHPTAEGPHH